MKAQSFNILQTVRKTVFKRENGFALVATLLLMVLLTVIAIGLMSLATVSLRTSSQDDAIAVAKANSRMAMMLAIGDLQKLTGPDTRVTARADILNQDYPLIVGVWNSWEGADHEQTGTAVGRPISPSSDYKAFKANHFKGWLVSGPPVTTPDSNILPSTTQSATSVKLVGAGTVGEGVAREKLEIHLEPTLIAGNAQRGGGAFAWWISGENQKAHISKPHAPVQDDAAGWVLQMKGHSVADPKPFRLDTLIKTPDLADKVISPAQADLIASSSSLKTSREFFHDYSTSATGLLTNTATGGWRKDFSLLTENWDSLPTSGLPFFQVKPGEDISYNRPVRGGNYQPTRSLLYPWSEYRLMGSTDNIFEMGSVCSWASLANFATLYKSMKSNGSAIDIQYAHTRDNDVLKDYDYHHKARILPVVARIQWVFSHWAGNPPAGSPPGTLQARLLVTPVFTLWNPYNVKISYDVTPGSGTQQALTFSQRASLPNAFRYKINGVQNTKYHCILSSSNNTSWPFSDPRPAAWRGRLSYSIRQSFTLEPGETRLFSPVATPATPSTELDLRPGYRPTGGHFFVLQSDTGTAPPAPASASISVDAKFDTINSLVNVGLYLDLLTMPSTGTNFFKMILGYRMAIDSTLASQVYLPINGLNSTTLGEAASQPQPFLTTILGPRTASNTHMPAKGLVQTSPFGSYTEMGRSGASEGRYPGDDHPVNGLFDFSFKALSSVSDYTPNNGPNNTGCIITGFQSATGLHRCVLSELPTRPIQSIAELTHWDQRRDNPKPPFSYNSIANSDASPLFARDAVWNPANSSKGNKDFQHDDSYCLNHLLFDDWFASSLAPNSPTLGAPTAGASLKKTYTDFLTGDSPLPNRPYKAIHADTAFATASTSNVDTLYDKHINAADSWRTIASRLEVEGMFNVNSTSVQAWRALLGHARGQKIPYFNAAFVPTLSEEKDYAFTRFTVSGDVEAKSTPAISGSFQGAAEFSGYRTLDDALLTLLAEQIVDQVRKRGPFLSLSEFVNRQLSSDSTLAIGGAVQVALDTLAKSSATNIYSKLQTPDTLATGNPPSVALAGYLFPDAAVGYNAYGLPGWTRQADVLRPIAPILSARDDTFTIRAYGDARDASGVITAKATCEVVVRRTRDYLDPTDAAELTMLPTQPTNQTFGRRYEIVSFRWLDSSET